MSFSTTNTKQLYLKLVFLKVLYYDLYSFSSISIIYRKDLHLMLLKMQDWAYQWKMQFYLDWTKQAVISQAAFILLKVNNRPAWNKNANKTEIRFGVIHLTRTQSFPKN